MKYLKFSLVFIISIIVSNSLIANDTESPKFAFDLYSQISEEENIIFSPLSINQAFSMLYPGTANNTFEQFRNVFYFDSDLEKHIKNNENINSQLDIINSHDKVDLIMKNATWIDERFKLYDSYINVIENNYNSELFLVNYSEDNEQITNDINSFVNENTKGNIKKILYNPLKKITRFSLVNVIYFNAEWLNSFNKEKTKEMDFYLKENITLPVHMMNQTEYYNYFENDEVQVVEIPYACEQLSMIVILPMNGYDINSLENELTYGNYLRLIDELYRGYPINLYLPKFEFEFEIDLKENLQKMGLVDAFSRLNADFSFMVTPEYKEANPYIDFAKHKAVIKMAEEGTEAAAATSVSLGCFSGDTLVQTIDGLKRIMDIHKGDLVISYDFDNQKWIEDKVKSVIERDAEGFLYTIKAGSTQFEATENHPIFVVSGKNLNLRKRPNDIPKIEKYKYITGRWVETQDLQLGDMIFSEKGELQVTEIRKRWACPELVYNISLEKYHNYSITAQGILVHNKASEESLPIEFICNHPFIFLIKEDSTNEIIFMGKVVSPEVYSRQSNKDKEEPITIWNRIFNIFR